MKTKKDKRSDLKKEYDDAVGLLRTMGTTSSDYQTQLKNVERLHKLLMEEEEHKNVVTKDGALACLTNLLGIGIIVGYEQFHHIGSKAISFVLKGRWR